MTTACLGTRAQNLLSVFFGRQLGLGSAQQLHVRLPKPLSCAQILDRQLGIVVHRTRSTCQPPSRQQRRQAASDTAQEGRLHVAAPVMEPTEEAGAAAAADAGAPAAEAAATDGGSAYEQQLAAKVAHVQQLFSDFDMPQFEIHRSQPDHYRLRAEFRVWHQGEETYYIMFEKAEGQGRPRHVRVDTFLRGSVLMNELMGLLMEFVAKELVLRQKLYQANFHTTLSGEAMVTLIYHRPLDATWEEAAKGLRKHLAQAPSCRQDEVTVIGRSRKRKLELDCSHVTERLSVDGQQFTFRQVEGAFSQPNGVMCQQMLGWARDVTAGGQAADLLELYCGNANFTIPLAANFRRVIATEVSKASVETAQHNLKANGVGNVMVARMSSEEFTAAWHEKRQMRRLEGLNWSELDLRTLLVDPPRAGLDDETVQLLKHFDTVVYISCNPATLVANLREVKDSHDIKRFAIFDQFPGTEHLECGAFLQRKADADPPFAAQAQQNKPVPRVSAPTSDGGAAAAAATGVPGTAPPAGGAAEGGKADSATAASVSPSPPAVNGS